MRFVWFVIATCSAAMLACKDSNQPGGCSLGTDVSVLDDFFSPSCAQVSPGATITWTWGGSQQHNVTFEGNSGFTGSQTQTSGIHTETFQAPGTFRYRCTNHSVGFAAGDGMVGTVVVQ